LQGLLTVWRLPDEAFVEAARAVAEQVTAEQSWKHGMNLLRYPLSSAIDAHRRFCYKVLRAWQWMACDMQLRQEDTPSTGSTIRGIGKRPTTGCR